MLDHHAQGRHAFEDVDVFTPLRTREEGALSARGKDASGALHRFASRKAAVEVIVGILGRRHEQSYVGAGHDQSDGPAVDVGFNDAVSYELYKAFGAVPTCTGHAKEYVRFWQGLGKTGETIPPLSIWDPAQRHPVHDAMFREVDGYNLGVHPMSRFVERTKADHATDIIENMFAGLGKPFFINTANNGTVPNMPDDAFLELMCDSTMGAVTPRPAGSAPVGLRGLWQQVLDAHELAVRAAVSGDRDILFRAFVCDPMISSLADSHRMIDELLAAERDALPEYWQATSARPR